MPILTKTLKDGRTVVIEIESRPNPLGGGEPRPYLVAYLDGTEVVVGEPWHVPEKMRPNWKGAAWVIGGKVGLSEEEGAPLGPALKAARDAHRADSAARLEAAIPGLAALKAARKARDAYDEGFAAMMEDEHNDGARPPGRPASDCAALARQYPRAALYLEAEHDSSSMSDPVAWGGEAAMKVLAEGGTLEAAREAMSAPIRATAAYQGRD